ncbi:ABC transporter substrate-binding protein [Pararhizobium sp.]|uniref:ABC transporter substrate-binding protein n=1 Tax=Pararhizobium sp. TaxID=1977563 RepID=UPI00272669AB|nr:extracellular solute-binding protein [Pararhizobium sp.]MDO9417765.1 extracellular solute-binding protein [Pararhizobium sp.]
MPIRSSQINRRTLFKGAGALALATALPGLSACSDAGGRTTIRFMAGKRETVDYFKKVAADFVASQQDYDVSLEQLTSVTADFVRDTPVSLALKNYTRADAGYALRGVLADLTGKPELPRLVPALLKQLNDAGHYGDETNIVPYSIAGQGVIYNRDLFDAAGLAVPTTWSEFVHVCETFKSRGITPIQGTFADIWTVVQGLFEFVTTSMIPDIPGFISQMEAQGTDIGPNSQVSFEKNLAAPCARIVEALPYFNGDAFNDTYSQGSNAYATGKTAMLMQGPWAYSAILSANPNIRVGMFVLPATENPDDRKCATVFDLVLWIPRSISGKTREGADALFSYLLRPEVVHTYNRDNLAFSPTVDAPPQDDPRVSDLTPFVSSGKSSIGVWRYFPPSGIDLNARLSQFIFDKDAGAFLRGLDADWKRLAVRTSV